MLASIRGLRERWLRCVGPLTGIWKLSNAKCYNEVGRRVWLMALAGAANRQLYEFLTLLISAKHGAAQPARGSLLPPGAV